MLCVLCFKPQMADKLYSVSATSRMGSCATDNLLLPRTQHLLACNVQAELSTLDYPTRTSRRACETTSYLAARKRHDRGSLLLHLARRDRLTYAASMPLSTTLSPQAHPCMRKRLGSLPFDSSIYNLAPAQWSTLPPFADLLPPRAEDPGPPRPGRPPRPLPFPLVSSFRPTWPLSLSRSQSTRSLLSPDASRPGPSRLVPASGLRRSLLSLARESVLPGEDPSSGPGKGPKCNLYRASSACNDRITPR